MIVVSPTRGVASRAQVADIYRQSLLELVFQAAGVHRAYFDPAEIPCSSLLSVKTGSCLPEGLLRLLLAVGAP